MGDPINAVKIFNEKEVDEILLLDIDASRQGEGPNFNLLERIGKEAFMPMSYGGGIRNLEDVCKVLSSGFEKISLNSEVLKNMDIITEISNIYGSQSVVVSIDVKKNILGKYNVFNYLTSKVTKIDPVKYAVEVENKGAGEILINSVDRDGMMLGYDLDIIRSISEKVNIPVIALGGAGKIQDFVDCVKIGKASAVSAGSMFVFQGIHKAVLITYPDRNELERAFSNVQ